MVWIASFHTRHTTSSREEVDTRNLYAPAKHETDSMFETDITWTDKTHYTMLSGVSEMRMNLNPSFVYPSIHKFVIYKGKPSRIHHLFFDMTLDMIDI